MTFWKVINDFLKVINDFFEMSFRECMLCGPTWLRRLREHTLACRYICYTSSLWDCSLVGWNIAGPLREEHRCPQILSYCKQMCKETVLQENNMVTNMQICENHPPSLNAVGACKMIQASWSFDLLDSRWKICLKCGGGNSVQYEMTWALFRDIFYCILSDFSGQVHYIW